MKNINNTYLDIKINLPKIDLDSKVADLIIDLEKLRHRKLAGTTPFLIYDEIKRVFQLLESLGSARIEGNRTTVSQLVEKIIEDVKPDEDQKLKEILNINKAIDFVKKNLSKDQLISKSLLFEVHKIIVDGLEVEGSKRPGQLRNTDNEIVGSKLKTPSHIQVQDYFDALFDFINDNKESKYDLLKTAIAHHRFAYIHPFDNGNGRTVRVLTYAMLIKYGFNIHQGDIINPTAIFCIDRENYYEKLSAADSKDESGILDWIYYVLSGLKKEMIKIDNISDIKYVKEKILEPSIKHALERKYINEIEYKILNYVISKKDMVLRNGDLQKCLNPDIDSRKRKEIIKKMKNEKLIKSIGGDKSRRYTISFSNNYLLRSLIVSLTNEGFIPNPLNKE